MKRVKNRMITTKYECFGGDIGFEQCPKGEFARISINPYNGTIVIVFNDLEQYEEVIEGVLHQVARDVHLMRMSSHGRNGLHEYANECDKGGVLDVPIAVKMARAGVPNETAWEGKFGRVAS